MLDLKWFFGIENATPESDTLEEIIEKEVDLREILEMGKDGLTYFGEDSIDTTIRRIFTGVTKEPVLGIKAVKSGLWLCFKPSGYDSVDTLQGADKRIRTLFSESATGPIESITDLASNTVSYHVPLNDIRGLEYFEKEEIGLTLFHRLGVLYDIQDLPTVTTFKNENAITIRFYYSTFQARLDFTARAKDLMNRIFSNRSGSIEYYDYDSATEIVIPLVKNYLDTTPVIPWTKERFLETDSSISNLSIGIDREGEAFYIDPLTHSLLVGATGAGKGSVIWSLIGALRTFKEVELYGIDVKGGAEFKTNLNVFSEMAVSPEDVCNLIIKFRDSMQERLNGYMSEKGIRNIKGHTSTSIPYRFLFVDEVNAMFAMLKAPGSSELRGMKKEALVAFDDILRMGRAAGYFIFAAGQDARVNNLPSRQLFTQRILLRTNQMNDQHLFGFGDAPFNTWRYSRRRDAGRGVIFNEDKGTYQEFKTFYPDETTIKSF